MKKLITLLLFIFSFSLLTSVKGQQWLWARQGISSIKAVTWAPSVATDRNGNVWHVGTFFTNVTFGNDTLLSPGEDVFLVKYDQNGNLQWAKQSVVSSGAAWGQFVATDDSGNAYITGYFFASVKFGTFTLSAAGTSWAVFFVKYDKNGNVIWAKQSLNISNANGYGHSVACDGKGFEYVTGSFNSGMVNFGSNSVTSANPAMFLVKYDYNGNVIWATQSTGTADSTFGNSVATSRTGDEYVTGYFNGAVSFGTYNLNATRYAIFLTKYDPSGNVLWAEQSKGNNASTATSSFDEGMSVATDIYDDAYLTGFFEDRMSFVPDTIFGITTMNMFYAKFAPNGTPKWLKQPIPLASGIWFGYSVSTDVHNHFYLSGQCKPSSNGKIVFSKDTLTAPRSIYGGASVLVKFDSAGNALCGSIFPTYNEEWSMNGEASDSTGNFVYMGGEFANENLILQDTLLPCNDGDLPYTARWTGCSESGFTASIISSPSTPCRYTCNGSATVTPSGGKPPYTFLWSSGQTTSSISSLCVGTYSVIVTDSSGYKSFQTTIITSPPGSLKITHSKDSICKGGSVNLNATGLVSYTWFPSSGLTCTLCPNPTATPGSTTTYYVTGKDTNTNGCIDTGSITILVTPPPTITITQETSSCSGSILLVASGATTYNWTPTASLSCSTCPYTYATPTITTTYTIVGTTNGCTDSTTFTVNPPAADSINLTVSSPFDTICLGDTVQIIATGNGVTRWVWTPSTGLSCNNCPNPKAYPTTTTTYYVYAYDSSGCDEELSITILVGRHTPTITVAPDTICPGDSALLIGAGGITYLWSTSQTSDSIWVKPATTTLYKLTSTTKGCVASTSAYVYVTPPPVISVVPSSDTICSGITVPLSASGAATYSWSPTTGLSCFTCPNPSATPTSTTTYIVTGTSAIGCVGTNMVTIVVTPPPVGSISSSTDTVCTGDTVLLKGSGGGKYQWSSGKTSDSIFVSPTSATTYSLVVTKNGCSDTVSKTIQVFSNSSATVSLSKDSICSGDSVVLSASGAASFKWSNGATTSSIKTAPATTVTYTLTGYSKCGTDTVIKTVHVIPYPVPLIIGKTTICQGKKDTLTASGGTTYLWSTGSTTTEITPTITGTTTITLTSFNGVCSRDTSIVITTLPSPTITVNNPNPVCPGDSAELIASGGGDYLWSTGSTNSFIYVAPASTSTYSVTVTGLNGCNTVGTGTVTVIIPPLFACCDTTIIDGQSVVIYADSSFTYKWYPSTGISCDTCPSVTVNPTITTSYTVIGTDKNGCETARIITIYVEPPCSDFIVPNVFTPNGDGINDEFVIKAENTSSYSIIIYDRWGKEMYKSTNPDVYWNGNTEAGAKSADGVYYYIIKSSCRNNNYNKDGFVQLIR